jgi:uncharacterized alkaline shock family protein YloU
MPEKFEHSARAADNSSLHISDDVIASLVCFATQEVNGVVSLSSAQTLTDCVGKKTNNKSVRILIVDGVINVDVAIVVAYSLPIIPICREVQNKVAQSLETMTGLKAGAVNVHVTGIAFEKEKK